MANIDWLGFLFASTAIVLVPGPGSIFVAKTAGVKGIKAGQMAMLGIMLGDTCLIALSLLGVSAILRACPVLFHGIRLIGAGYLIYLGMKAIFSKQESENQTQHNPVLSMRQAFTITLLNPKAVLFFMAFFPLFIQPAKGELLFPYLNMSVVFMLISFAYLSILSFVSARIGIAFQASQRIRSITQKVCGCIFVGFGIKVALSSK